LRKGRAKLGFDEPDLLERDPLRTGQLREHLGVGREPGIALGRVDETGVAIG
jgi:hypothetical protein